MTIITFKRNGGFAGNGIDLRLDLNSLPAGEAQQLLQLVEEADFFHIPINTLPSEPITDEFIYTISLEAGSTAVHSVRTSDTTMPEPLRPLVEELSKLAYASSV